MNPDTKDNIIHYFVDEAGDPNIFDRRGKIIVGQEGCSSWFMLGKLDVAEPQALAGDMEKLRNDLLSDRYFKNVPSMQPEAKKTALAFHANNDLPEVRREVFKLLMKQEHQIRFYGVVRDKNELLSYVRQQNERDEKYRYHGNELYDNLTTVLFSSMHRVADFVDICFARRGNKSRTQAFERALSQAEIEFEKRYGIKQPNPWGVQCCLPAEAVCLQAVDYFMWAAQRYYERREGRFLELLWPKVAEIHDLDRVADGRNGVRYNSKNPMNLEP